MAKWNKGNLHTLVEERRLRPIYDLLDSNNNKKVVQEVDRLLKKQPNFACAKVLKGLALLRLGKTKECLSIITPVFHDTSIDENTIDTLTICYRELDEPEMVCKLLERASADDVNEDRMTQCFMAQVRVSEFQKQYQTAMKLYKMYQKIPYFSWAVMSLLVKAERDTDPVAVKVSLTLAERMMSKLFEENNIESEHEYCLYTLILKKQKNYKKILDIMNGPNGKKVSVTTGFFHRNVVECLKEENDEATLITFLEEAITTQPDEWNFYKEYIEYFTKTETERVRNFLKALNSDPTDRLALRPVLLSHLLFIKTARDLGLDHQMNISKILTSYLTEFGSKPYLFADIKFSLKLVNTNEDIKDFLANAKSLMPDSICYTNVDHVQREINNVILTRYFNSEEIRKSTEKILNFVQLCVKYYLDARDEQVESGSDMTLRDGLPQDDFMAVAAMTLMESFWSGSGNSVWTDYFEACQKSQELSEINNVKGERRILSEKLNADSSATKDTTSEKTDIIEQDFLEKDREEDSLLQQMMHTVKVISKEFSASTDINKINFAPEEEEVPIFLSMAILEFLLERSPNSSQALLLLAKTYMRCGAIGAGADIIIDLDLKHIQWESLGYLFMWKLQTSGFYREAHRIFQHRSSQEEIIEHVLSAYKYGSWEKILEFLEFRDLLTNSIQFALITVEGKLFQYAMDCCSSERTLEMAQYIELEQISPHFANFERYKDNRDLTVLLTYCDKSPSEDLQKLTFSADVERLKIRSLLLSLMTNFALLPTLDATKYKTSLTEIENSLLKLKVLNENDYSAFDVQNPPFYEMWKSNLHRYISAGYLHLLINMLSLNFEMAKDAKDEQIKTLILQITESIKTVSDNSFKIWRLNVRSLLYRADLVEDVFMLTETLAFFCILLDVFATLVKKSFPLGKTKKKKAHKNCDFAYYEHFNSLLNVTSEVVQKVEQEVLSFEFIKDPYPTKWSQMSEFWSGKVNNDLYSYILPVSLPCVMEKLNQSYTKSIKQMAANIKLRQKYIEELHKQFLS